MITSGHKKMSKSLGNFATLRDAAALFPHEVIRFLFVSAHYRMPMEYSAELLQAAQNGLERIKNCRARFINTPASLQGDNNGAARFRHDFERAMEDDFNTANAVTVIFELVKYINTQADPSNNLLTLLDELCGLLGLVFADEAACDAEVERLLALRAEARARKDFTESDRIRDELLSMGITIKDTRAGVTWSRA
jgi:cysteinyl-tRNA synthetase